MNLMASIMMTATFMNGTASECQNLQKDVYKRQQQFKKVKHRPKDQTAHCYSVDNAFAKFSNIKLINSETQSGKNANTHYRVIVKSGAYC